MPARALPRWIPEPIARHIEGRPVASAILQNASWLVSERLVQMLVGFVISAWMVRYLGPGEFGRYSFALSFASLFWSVATLGMDPIVVRELARQPTAEGEILGTALGLRLAVGLASWAACSAAILFLRDDGSTRILTAVLGANAMFLAAGIFDLWFQARIAARDVVVTRTLVNLLIQGLRGGLILLAASVTGFAALVPLNGALAMLGTYGLYRRQRAAEQRLRWRMSRALSLARDSLPMLATSICIAVYAKIDQVMLTSICGDRENGIYAPAAALSELFAFVPLAISGSAFPVIVKAIDGMSQADYERRLKFFYDGMVAAGYLFAVSLIVFATPIVGFLYGSAYQRTATVLQVHAGSFLFTTLGVARSRHLVARNHLGFILGAAVLGAVSNVLLNLALLPGLGAVGAAWATLLSYSLATYFSGFLWRPAWRQTALLTRSLALPVRLVAGAFGYAARAAKRR
jgi:O-antigen/teichoic acid export membrane protein